MKKRMSMFSKNKIPTWLIALALIASGAGAAAGTVLAGSVTAEVPVAVSQALLVSGPSWLTSLEDTVSQDAPQQLYNHLSWVHAPNRGVAVVADDNTGFQAAAEVAIGDWIAFKLPIKNASDNDLVAELMLSVPDCLEIEVFSDLDLQGNDVGNPVRTGYNTWKFEVGASSDGITDPNDILYVIVSIDDDCLPGYFSITGTLKQISY